MTIALDLAYGIALLLAAPWLWWRRRARAKSAAGGGPPATLAEYFGRVPSRRVAARCVWIHGVSLGEINATRTLVAQLQRELPELAIVISSTTQTGLARARALYPDLMVFRFPFDFSFVIRRVLDRVRPSLIVLMELEVWPNLIAVAAGRNIPVVIANGRVTSEKSMKRFSLPVVRRVARRMFSRLAWVGAQDATYAGRFAQLGVPKERIEVTGSVKYDAADLQDHVEGQDALAAALQIDRGAPLWVCGSTGPEEEAMLLRVYAQLRAKRPQLQLAIIPRKPERFDEVAALIARSGFACRRRSTGQVTGDAGGLAVILGDTMGELRKFYALADVVFVGRTLVPLGGSDLMEVAGLAKAMTFGPYVENFAEAAEILLAAGGAAQVKGEDELRAAVERLLDDREARAAMGRAARAAILTRRGATDRTVNRLREWLEAQI
jgi:3-deoxy-D-manno-octulosonic-acid transferase